MKMFMTGYPPLGTLSTIGGIVREVGDDGKCCAGCPFRRALFVILMNEYISSFEGVGLDTSSPYRNRLRGLARQTRCRKIEIHPRECSDILNDKERMP
jgi:hypothetical protein